MRLIRDIRAFLRLPYSRKRIVIEAICELSIARIRTLRSAAHYTKYLGRLDGPPPTASATDQQGRAEEIGNLVERIAPRMPFQALCLQQALAVRQMLRRRHIDPVVHLGLLEAPEQRGSSDGAHAWVEVGDRVVCGAFNGTRYVIVGTFT